MMFDQAETHGGRRFVDAEAALKFIFGGNSTVTLVSLKTSKRYTYRVRLSDDHKRAFVKVLVGANNEADYEYLGFVPMGEMFKMLVAGAKGNANHPAAKAFSWTIQVLNGGRIADMVEIWHEGRCGRCHRKLTVPESIASGFGPECINHV